MVIITNKGWLYEYKSSGFDTKAKAVKRVAESNDETSMAKVGAFSFLHSLLKPFPTFYMLYFMALGD